MEPGVHCREHVYLVLGEGGGGGGGGGGGLG